MRIDGKVLAQNILEKLQKDVVALNIIPHLVAILIGNDPASEAYVRQKELKANKIGAKATVLRFPSNVSQLKINKTIAQLNNDRSVHGIIVQRPLPKHFDPKTINQAVVPKKDVDAFHTDSPFEMPLALAVSHVLEYVFNSINKTSSISGQNVEKWLRNKQIVIIGKGETGGGPTINLLRNKGIACQIIDSKTKNPDSLLQSADIVISAVGKPGVLKPERLKKGVILIGVGMNRGADGKLHGDYEEKDVENVSSYYTPIPGGIGPINVAMLLSNLIQAAKILTNKG